MIHRLHPAWKVCIGMAILLFVVIAHGSRILVTQNAAIKSNERLLQDTQEELEKIQTQQKSGEERAYIARAISGCSDLINDGEIEITEECTDERVAAYYTPSICAKLPIAVENCGAKAVVVEPEGD